MFLYQKFYISHGIRRLQQLNRPPMAGLFKLALPLNSVYHCTEFDPNDVGVMPDDEILTHIRSDVIVDHVTELDKSATLGTFSEIPLQATMLLQAYHRENKNFKRNTNISLLNNNKTLLVMSYNLLARKYRYLENYATPYYRWANLLTTVVATINKLAKTTDRHHFLQMHMPVAIPALSWLENAIDAKDQTTIKRFNTDSLRLISDLYTWISERRSESILSKLDSKVLDKVNIILVINGQWTAINLGVLDSFRLEELTKEQVEALDANAKKERMGKTPARLLKQRFVRYLISVSESSTVVADVVDDQDDIFEEKIEDKERTEDTLDLDATEEESKTLDEQIKERLSTTQKTGSLQTAADNVNNKEAEKKKIGDDGEIIDEEDKELTDGQISKDLKRLEELAKEREAELEANTTYRTYEPPSTNLEDGVVRKANELVRLGKLSAAEHRALTQMATRYKTIKNPFNGNETLEQMVKIDPESLKVAEKTPLMPAIKGVVDESMLSSSIKTMDNRYIREVMQKDIAAAVLSLQQGGFVVRNYNVRHYEDLTDSFDVIDVDVVPLVGEPTTLRIQIPTVNENGQMKVGNVISRMRKQRGD